MTTCLWCQEPPHFEVRLGYGWVPACSAHSNIKGAEAVALLALSFGLEVGVKRDG